MNESPGRLAIALALALLPLSRRASAQHEHHHEQPDAEAPATMSTSDESTRTLADDERARNPSGTAWQPATTPHAAFHAAAGGFDLMLHGVLFAGYDTQRGPRGDDAVVGIGWVMGMARRRLGSGGDMTLRAMLSPEPWTVRDGGYPLLLQTGETYRQMPLHDRQHPHDLFMELGALYTQPLARGLAIQIYAAPSGEPALGPVAFPHRASAKSDPLATLGHHWQDSTHISFGVLTAGIITRYAKLEGSWFNGREPDEQRADLDLRAPDSYSIRLSVAPSPELAGQVSYGYLPDPESLHPDAELHRVTASLAIHRAFGSEGQWSAMALAGRNKEAGEAHATWAALIETDLAFDRTNTVFGRIEAVDKTGHDLVLDPAEEESTFTLTSFVAGYLRSFGPFAGWVPGVGARIAVNVVPEEVLPIYGSRALLGAMVFLRLGIAPASHLSH